MKPISFIVEESKPESFNRQFDFESFFEQLYGFVPVILLLVFAFIFSAPLSAQTLKPVSVTGKGFDVNSGAATALKFTVDGKTFDVYTSSSGSKYVKGISTAGKEYAIWIGEETTLTYEGKKARVFKSGTYAVFTLNSKGYPSPKWLKKE